jgi:hypothetical protein
MFLTADGLKISGCEIPASHCGPFVLFCRFPMDIIILVKLALKHELLEFNLLLKRII